MMASDGLSVSETLESVGDSVNLSSTSDAGVFPVEAVVSLLLLDRLKAHKSSKLT